MEKLTMKVPEMAKQMGISNPVAYELCKREDFPAITVGKRIIIVTKLFEEWLEKEVTSKANAGR